MRKQPTRLFDFLYYQSETFPLEVMMISKVGQEWKSYSTAEVIDKTNRISKGLIALGVQPGQKIALITHANQCAWNITDLGILQIGAVDVPIYPTMTVEDYVYILNHSEIGICFVSNKDLYDKVRKAQQSVPTLKKIYSFDRIEGVENWEDVMNAGAAIPDSAVEERKNNVKESDLATIIYTSGTTGLPKGVMLSHSNITSNVNDSQDRLPVMESGKSRTLSFLPCCHVFERMLHYLYMKNSVSMYLTGMDQIKDDLMVAKPHIFTGVPRLFEKFYDGIYAKGMANTGIKKALFKWAHDLALRWEPDRQNGGWYEFQLGIARKLVFSKVKAALGLTEIKCVASGSAALHPRLARFFTGAGIDLKQGYGLTETSPVISVNTLRRPGMWRAESVGKPINNVIVKIAEDGEILCKGSNVMMGYYKEPGMTAEVLKDGWFHTGDIGEIRDEFLYITDRKKEMFKTSGGKYISPQLIENALKESAYIEQAMVIGEGQNFPAALVVPDYVVLHKWAQNNGIKFNNNNDLCKDPKVIALIKSEIDPICSRFGKWEQVKEFRLLPSLFTIEAGEITPTLKLKRKGILTNHHNLVEDIYRNSHTEDMGHHV